MVRNCEWANGRNGDRDPFATEFHRPRAHSPTRRFAPLPEIAAGQSHKDAGSDEVGNTDPQTNVLPEAGWFDNRRKHGGNVRKYAG